MVCIWKRRCGWSWELWLVSCVFERPKSLKGRVDTMFPDKGDETWREHLHWFLNRQTSRGPSNQFYSLTSAIISEKAMAPHCSTLAWKIPWTEEPGRLQSVGSLRVGHDWATSLSLFTLMHWRRKWQPTPVFLPAESQGWGSLVSCHLWGRTESDTTEAT